MIAVQAWLMGMLNTIVVILTWEALKALDRWTSKRGE